MNFEYKKNNISRAYAYENKYEKILKMVCLSEQTMSTVKQWIKCEKTANKGVSYECENNALVHYPSHSTQ